MLCVVVVGAAASVRAGMPHPLSGDVGYEWLGVMWCMPGGGKNRDGEFTVQRGKNNMTSERPPKKNNKNNF